MIYRIKVTFPDDSTKTVSVDAFTQDGAHTLAAGHAALSYARPGVPDVPKGTETKILEPLALEGSTHTF